MILEFIWQEDTDGVAVPTLVITGVPALEVATLTAIAEAVSEHNVYPERIDVTYVSKLTGFMGLDVVT